MQKIQNYINGKLVAPLNGEYLDNVNPATGKLYSYIPDSGAEDIEMAVKAAKDAFPVWSELTAEDRYGYMIKLSNLIDRDVDKLAMAESVDNGKPLWLAKKVDIPRAKDNFKFFHF